MSLTCGPIRENQLRPSDEGDHFKWAIGKANRKDGEGRASLLDSPALKEQTLTESVSAHGARVLSKRKLEPLQQAVLTSPDEGVWTRAREVYCHRISESDFAVGLERSGRVDSWSKPY